MNMDTFTAVSEPTRRAIIELVARNGAMSTSDISEHFSSSLPAISQHLKVLRETGMVTVKKDGQRRLYELDIEGMYKIEMWTHKYIKMWQERFDRLEALLQNN